MLGSRLPPWLLQLPGIPRAKQGLGGSGRQSESRGCWRGWSSGSGMVCVPDTGMPLGCATEEGWRSSGGRTEAGWSQARRARGRGSTLAQRPPAPGSQRGLPSRHRGGRQAGCLPHHHPLRQQPQSGLAALGCPLLTSQGRFFLSSAGKLPLRRSPEHGGGGGVSAPSATTSAGQRRGGGLGWCSSRPPSPSPAQEILGDWTRRRASTGEGSRGGGAAASGCGEVPSFWSAC